MASQKTCTAVDIEDVVQKTLEELKNNQLIPEYERHEGMIMEVLEKAAQMEATLTTEMVPMIDNDNMGEVELAVLTIIRPRHIFWRKLSFAIETYSMKVVKRSDGHSVVKVQRKGVEFQPEIMLMTTNDIDIATWLQSASLVIELLLFLLSCGCIGIDLSEAELRTLVQEVERFVREPEFQRALNKFVDAWNKAGGIAWREAKAIFYFLKDMYLLGMLLKIIALIYKTIFHKWNWIEPIIEVVLMIVAAFATDGLALIARIVPAVDGDVHLAMKITNLVTFSDMKEEVAAEDLLKKALEELEKYQLIPDYEKHKKDIKEVLKKAAQMEVTLTTEMVHMIDNKTMREVEQAISAIIGQERVDLIKISFAIETYRMEVVKKSDGQSVVQVQRHGVEFHSEIMLMSIKDIETATLLQWASLVLELFLFVLSCVGIRVDLSEDEMRTLVQEVEGLVREPAFRRALNKFLEAWKEAKDSASGKAKAIFYLLKESYSLDIFWKIIKLIYKNMSKWQMIKSMAEVVLMIVAAFTTAGLALIGRIAIALDKAGKLKEKIANLVTFSDMKKEVAAAEDLLKKALEELEKYQLIPDYERHKKDIKEVLKKAAQMEVTLTTEMVHMIDNKTMREVEQAISAIIGQERVDLIKISFAIETYRMEVVKKSDGQSVVQVQRHGVEFHSEIMMMSIKDIETATVLQWASLVLELFLFVLSCVGIRVDLSEDEMRTLVQEVEGLVRKPAFQRALNKFLEAWKEAKDSAWEKAKAIFYLLKESYSLDIFWKIIKLIYKNMSKWQMIKAMAEVVLMIVAAFTTAGLALIARIAIALDKAGKLKEKIANLVTFADMKKEVAAEDLLKKALEELEKYQLIPDYERHKNDIKEVLKKAAQMEVTLTTEMVHMIDNKTMREVEQAISAIIGQERVDLIKISFAIETYRMEVVKKSDGQSVVQVQRHGVEFHSEIMMMSIKDIETATVLQWASLVLELFLFVLSCVGIRVDLSEDEMRILVQEVEGLVRKPAFQRALNKFLEAWKEAKDSASEKAKAIFYLLKESYSLDIFWKLIKLIYKNMSKWQMIKAMPEVVLMIVAAFTTEGFALIGRIAIALDKAGNLKDNIANLVTFSDMRKTMK